MRHLGKIWALLTSSQVKSIIMHEIAARVIKVCV